MSAPSAPPLPPRPVPDDESPVCVNGELLPRDRVLYPRGDLGWLRGYGVFETVYLHPRGCFRLEEHLDRLEHSAGLLRIPFPPREDLHAGVRRWVEASGHRRARVRLLLMLDGESPWWMVDGEALAPRPPLEERGLRMWISHLTVPPPPLGSAKTISRVAYELAALEARQAGCDDAILPTVEGQIGESTRANLFWAQGGRLHTPPVTLGILAGVTRGLLVREFSRRGVHVDERETPLEVLWEAEEIFVCSTVRGIAPVVSLQDPADRSRSLPAGAFVDRAEKIVCEIVASEGLEA